MEFLSYAVFSLLLPMTIGFLGMRATIAVSMRYMDYIPYEWAQINKPARIGYCVAAGIYLWAGFDMVRETGSINAWYIAMSVGALAGMYVFWWREVSDEDDEVSDPAVTIGDPFDRK